MILELEGYEVEVAATTAHSSRLISERRPDLILMDVQLSGEDARSPAVGAPADRLDPDRGRDGARHVG
ncbi:MAG: hypothetical protein WB682_00430 [Candidatus Dormiibacterota bacterium]